ncbi:Retrovirus-related Pol polyprotein from transposon 17.6, partial [Mucuna pruriens]
MVAQNKGKTTFTCPYGTFAYGKVPFGLCNTPRTFQRCMMALFSNLMEEYIEIFMDDFFVFGPSFDKCLYNLNLVLKKVGIEVDPTKVEVITKLLLSMLIRTLRSFLGHVGFYRRFDKSFSKIAKSMTNFLAKDVEFMFSDAYLKVFELLNEKLTNAPMVATPN